MGIVQLKHKFNHFVAKHKLESFRDVGFFIVIILTMHVIWRVWSHQFEFHILGVDVLGPANAFLTQQIRIQASWFLNHILHIHTEIEGELFVFSAYSRMGITAGCSGLKQFYQFFGIIALFYGPWKKKAWFIPMGMLIIHIVNLLRIIFLSIIVIYKLEWFNFLHDWIVRPIFYVVMFMLWVWWVEKIAKKTATNNVS